MQAHRFIRDLTTASVAACACAAIAGCRLPNYYIPYQPPGGSTPAPAIYIVDYGNSVEAYPLNASGNQPPSSSISGANTGLAGSGTDNLTIDQVGNVYTTDNLGIVRVFAGKPQGNVAPIQTISGGNTTLTFPIGIAVDRSAHMWVADCGTGRIDQFPANANGNVTPTTYINVGAYGCEVELATDASGDVFVTFNADTWAEYPAGAGPATPPLRLVTGPSTGLHFPRSIALDAAGDVYVGNMTGQSITVYPPAGTGNVAPIRTIAGSNTGLGGPSGLAVDSAGRLYVTICQHCSNGSGTDEIEIFAPGANGNVAPTAVIQGAATAIAGPTDIALPPGT